MFEPRQDVGQTVPSDAGNGPALLRNALLWSILLTVVLALGAMQTEGLVIEKRPDIALTMYFALKQDVPLAGWLVLLLV